MSGSKSFKYNSQRGQSEVIGTILAVAIMVMLATVAGGAVLTQFGSTSETPIAEVSYDVELNTSGGTATYDLTVTTTAMQRADSIDTLYNGSRQEMNSIGDEVVISNVQDGDIIYIVGEYNGTERVISSYTFNEEQFQRDQT